MAEQCGEKMDSTGEREKELKGSALKVEKCH